MSLNIAANKTCQGRAKLVMANLLPIALHEIVIMCY